MDNMSVSSGRDSPVVPDKQASTENVSASDAAVVGGSGGGDGVLGEFGNVEQVCGSLCALAEHFLKAGDASSAMRCLDSVRPATEQQRGLACPLCLLS